MENSTLNHSTILEYKTVINEFDPLFIKWDGNLGRAAREYLDILANVKHNQYTTINKKISILKKYVRFLVIEGDLEEKQYQSILKINRRSGNKIPKFYNYSIIKRYYLVLTNSKAFDPIEKMILFFILNHGMTKSEIYAIEFKNINWCDRYIIIHLKHGIRFVYLGKEDLTYLMKFIIYQKDKIQLMKCPFLFQCNGALIKQKIFMKALEKMSMFLNEKLTQRNLRNTFIVYAIDLGVDIIYIKNYLGLKSFSSILRFEYLSNSFINVSKLHINQMRSKITTNNFRDLPSSKQKVIHIYEEDIFMKKFKTIDQFKRIEHL